jgi:hypothetical protein
LFFEGLNDIRRFAFLAYHAEFALKKHKPETHLLLDLLKFMKEWITHLAKTT